MTPLQREALQMCLEYIETDAHERRHVRWKINEALAESALERMAENARELGLAYEQPAPVREPVGYWLIGSNLVEFKYNDSYHDGPEWQPLYASPPTLPLAQRPWVGLTDQEIENLWNQHEPRFDYYSFSCDIEAKLKAKNSP